MRIVDLTREIAFPTEMSQKEDYFVPLRIGDRDYTALCHKLHCDGMTGTYLDFPGHVVETDDGVRAADVPLERLFMLEATVLRLDRDPANREVTADELEAAGAEVKGDALIVHALGPRAFHEFSSDTIPYYGPSAIRWIMEQDFAVFASDIYENKADLQGIFTDLFARGALAVCCPVNLHAIREAHPRACVIPARMEGVAQLPCRFFVVEGVADAE